MSSAEPWTIGRLLQWTTEYLKKHGSDSARLDAEVLLAEALGCRRIDLYTRFDEVPAEDVRTAFRELVRKRAEGMPVAYLVGRREFFSLAFRVTPDVLIPRPETEFLVIALIDLARARPPGEEIAICDIGTGSGIIAITAAKHLPQARVTAVDVSSKALDVARRNASDHGVADRIQWIESDLFAALPAERRFDFVVSNPPYVAEGEQGLLSLEVRRYEPREALFAGPRGTEVIERLVPQAAERLKAGGHLLVEISPMIHDAARAIVEADARLRLEPTIKDLARHPRVIHAVKKP
jgi:release factor glutamine methyltransferase